MTVNLSPRVRLAIFVLNLLGTPVVVYALAKGWIGELELTLWGGEVAAAFALAGLNVPSPTLAPPASAEDVARIVNGASKDATRQRRA